MGVGGTPVRSGCHPNADSNIENNDNDRDVEFFLEQR